MLPRSRTSEDTLACFSGSVHRYHLCHGTSHPAEESARLWGRAEPGDPVPMYSEYAENAAQQLLLLGWYVARLRLA